MNRSMYVGNRNRNHQSTLLSEISGNNEMNKLKFCSFRERK